MTKTLSRPVNKSKRASGNSQAEADAGEMSLEELEAILGGATDIQHQVNGLRFNREAKLTSCIELFRLLKIYADPHAKPEAWIPKMIAEIQKQGMGPKLVTHGPDMNKRFWSLITAMRQWMKNYIETKKENGAKD